MRAKTPSLYAKPRCLQVAGFFKVYSRKYNMFVYIPISRNRHLHKHYLPRYRYSFTSEKQIVPILIAELSMLLPFYALGFIQQKKNSYYPAAVIGIGSKRNLYINNSGKWLCRYVPAVFRGYPFALADNKQGEKVLCVEGSHLSDEQGQPLFDSEGNLTKPVQDTLNFLNECEKNRKVTQTACQALNKAGVIEKWDLQVKQSEDQDPVNIDGLYRISEKALNELDKETFADLRKNGVVSKNTDKVNI
jgi:uncharacterized protein YxjI